MAKLVYSAIASLDGYVADERGEFGWSMPDEEVHAFVNDLERPIGTYLYGRRMYEVMKVWEGDEVFADAVGAGAALLGDYAAIWREAEKIVYSRTLGEVSTARTRLKSSFDPAEVSALKEAEERDISIGGPELATQALGAGLVDEIHLFLAPVGVGAGKPAFPIRKRLPLRLRDHRSFDNGTMYVHYRL
ncbi:MAG: dihydrofolate reductase family protein [Solirubrobacterales bacterium]